MHPNERKFHRLTEKVGFDLKQKNKLQQNLRQYASAHLKGKQQFTDYELAVSRASYIRKHTLSHLDHYLLRFEENFVSKGGKVIWATDGQEAAKIIYQLCKERQAESLLRSQATILEEIALDNYLKTKQLTLLSTDFEEWLSNFAGGNSGHFSHPLSHLNKKEIWELAVQKLSSENDSEERNEELLLRKWLFNRVLNTKIAVTGVNFLLSDAGTVVCADKDIGQGLAAAYAETLIVVAGMEQVLPHLSDLYYFMPLLSAATIGKNNFTYQNIYTGPQQPSSSGGFSEIFVILLDNGRSEMLADKTLSNALKCIRCGACQNVCPVYQTIGGKSYASAYSGPIGAIISPYLLGWRKYRHLSGASTLCGACSEICPVKIDLPALLLHNRKKALQQMPFSGEKWAYRFWRFFMLNKIYLRGLNGRMKKNLFLLFFGKWWGKRKQAPVFNKKTFEQLWKDPLKR